MSAKYRPKNDPVQKLNEYEQKIGEHADRIRQASFDPPEPIIPYQPTTYDASIWSFAEMKVNGQWVPYKDDHDLLKGNDKVRCRPDRDPQGRIIHTYEGNDNITGSHYDDIIYAGPGNDNLEGGGGVNLLYGGEGNDRYIFLGEGTQIITDCSGADAIHYIDHAIDNHHFILFENIDNNQAIFCAYESLNSCRTQHSPAVIINDWNNPACKIMAIMNDTHIAKYHPFLGYEGCWTFVDFNNMMQSMIKAHAEL